MGSRDPVIALPIEVAMKTLTREDESDLSKLILSGNDRGHKAYKELVESNLRLVRAIVQNYRGRGVSMRNLISSGNMGLMRAATKFDPRRGAKFSSYAQWWINRSIKEELARGGNYLSVSPSTLRRARRLEKVAHVFQERHHREPSAEELAAAAKETIRRVRSLIDLFRFKTSSIEHGLELGHEVAAEAGNFLADDDTCRLLRSCLLRLPEREQIVIVARFGLEGSQMTLKAVGKRLGLTSERVRQLETMALGHLKEMMERGG